MNAQSLLESLFPEEKSRPTKRWLDALRLKGQIPFLKLGKYVFYDFEEVRAELDARFSQGKLRS